MVNYEVNPAVLIPYLPKGTELDFWKGKTFVSLVGFMFLDTYLLGIPVPFHRNFEEVNLRFYIKCQTDDGERRGVAFIKEIVPKWTISTVANFVYNERYAALPMRHRIHHSDDVVSAEYEWKFRNNWQRIAVKCSGKPQDLVKNSDAEFFTEHYWGYSVMSNGETLEYQVEHVPWKVWSCEECEVKVDVEALYGQNFAPFLKNPHSSLLAEGSPIKVHKAQYFHH